MSLRLYTFVNFYLSSIQQGIQSAHVAVELFNEYRGKRNAAASLLKSWAEEHKTMIVLNGGMACNVAQGYEEMALRRASTLSTYDKCPYPYAAFYEEPGAIHHARSAITAWGIVLPSEVYDAKPVELFPSRSGFSIYSQEELEKQPNLQSAFWESPSIEHYICGYLQGKRLAQ